MARKLSKAALKKKRQRIARANFSHTKKRRSSPMTKKRKSYSRKRSGGVGNLLMKGVMGAVVVVGYEALISPLIPATGTTKNIVEMAIGGLMATTRGMPPLIKEGGKMLIGINAVQLIAPLMGGLIAAPSGNGSGVSGY